MLPNKIKPSSRSSSQCAFYPMWGLGAARTSLSSPNENENLARSLLDSGDIHGAIHKYSLASRLYKDRNKGRKATETKLLSKLLSAIVKGMEAVTEEEFRSSISDFEEVGQIIDKLTGKEKEGIHELVDGLTLLAKASIENIHGRSHTAIQLLQDAERIFGLVEDKLPHIIAFLENQRLVASFAAHSIRALTASGSDNAAYQMNRAAAFKDIEKLKMGGHFTDLLAVQLEFIDSIVPFNTGLSLLRQNLREARRYIMEAEKRMSESIRRWEAVSDNAKKGVIHVYSNEIIIRGIKGISQTAKGLVSYIDGESALYLGDTVGARKGFAKALKILKSSAENVASLGDYSKYLLNGIDLYERNCTYHLNSMSNLSSGERRRLGLSAGKQFGLLFAISLISFISLSVVGLIETSTDTILVFSLMVSAISVFGLNATKLFNVFPSNGKGK